MATESGMLTVAVVARRLRVSRQTIYKLCRSGKMPHTLVNTESYRISEEQYAEFMRQATRPMVYQPNQE